MNARRSHDSFWSSPAISVPLKMEGYARIARDVYLSLVPWWKRPWVRLRWWARPKLRALRRAALHLVSIGSRS